MVKNLRKLRVGMGLSQQQLADVIGTSQQSINKYENHGVEPDIDTLIKFSDYFNTTIDTLVGHTPTNSQNTIEIFDLDCAELSFIKDFRKLSTDERKSILLIIQNYLKNK